MGWNSFRLVPRIGWILPCWMDGLGLCWAAVLFLSIKWMPQHMSSLLWKMEFWPCWSHGSFFLASIPAAAIDTPPSPYTVGFFAFLQKAKGVSILQMSRALGCGKDAWQPMESCPSFLQRKWLTKSPCHLRMAWKGDHHPFGGIFLLSPCGSRDRTLWVLTEGKEKKRKMVAP